MVTVRDVVEDALPSGTAIIGGEGHLERRVSRALLLKSRPPGLDTLHGGELLLISTEALRILDPDLRLARALSQIGPSVSAVVVEGKVPEDAAAEAEELRIGLLQLPPGATARATEAEVTAFLGAQRLEWYRRRHEVLSELTALATRGHGLGDIAARLAEESGLAVVLLDAGGDDIARSVPPAFTGAERELIDAFPRDASSIPVLSAAWDIAGGSTTGSWPPPTLARMSAPILVREKQVATIWLVGDASGAAEEWQFYLETGAAAAAIDLSRAHAVEETVHRIHGDFVADLVRGTGDAEVVASRAKRMGFDLSAPHVAIALLPVPVERSPRAKTSVASSHGSDDLRNGIAPTNAMEEAIQRIGRRIPRVLNAHGVNAPAYREPGLVTIFYPVDETTASASARRLAQRLCGDLSRAATGCELFAGVSGPHSGVVEFQSSYGEAKQSVELARTVMSETQVVCYSDLGVYRLLLAARGTSEMRDLYVEMLGSLAAYDQKTKSDLIPTLAAYLRSGNAVEVAQTMNLHRNTLRYRLRRIRDISRLDLDDPDIRLGLQVALKISDVLGLGKPPNPDQVE